MLPLLGCRKSICGERRELQMGEGVACLLPGQPGGEAGCGMGLPGLGEAGGRRACPHLAAWKAAESSSSLCRAMAR